MTTIKDRLPTTIHTGRLVLTTPTMAHAPAIAALANNENVHRWLARLPFPYGVEDARMFVEEFASSDAECCFAILRDGEFVGVVGLSLVPGEPPELGYWLGEPFWGLGYATEAAQAVVEAARANGATAVRSRALADNRGSRNVLRKAGFRETHEGIESKGNCTGKPTVYLHQDLSR
ncbi:GNAT family N-acetyltransferase [Devosia aurantiaca]|uniref:GNAT family N-acetyltransferase n=1 Tax=Devosia aurantiaca TaxID=2714858 RepID=A0A6M1SLZ0_9HYPH|nr:GNAT family N-acetyltransferase [Devosia aurantiaca]NGP16552.1 GNAT family N-acetyltransferase [Devosia aurantiaca]